MRGYYYLSSCNDALLLLLKHFLTPCLSLYSLPGENDAPDGLDITFNVKETRRIAGSAHTSIGNNEGNLVCIAIK